MSRRLTQNIENDVLVAKVQYLKFTKFASEKCLIYILFHEIMRYKLMSSNVRTIGENTFISIIKSHGYKLLGQWEKIHLYRLLIACFHDPGMLQTLDIINGVMGFYFHQVVT